MRVEGGMRKEVGRGRMGREEGGWRRDDVEGRRDIAGVMRDNK